MALNFPNNPAVGDIYRNEGASFQWNGVVWLSLGSSANLGVPVGTVAYFAGPTVPDGWLLCDNQAVSALYPDLRDYLLAAGSPFGTSGADPRVPDLRGEFIRGHVGGRTGVDDGRVFGSFQSDAIRAHDHQVIGQVLDGSIPGGTATPSVVAGNRLNQTRTNLSAGAETRPRNVALLPCIKAFDAVDITGMADLAELLTAIATEAEARAGISNEKLMTPANAQALPMIGVGQTWRTIPPADRPVDTPHQNTAGRPIMVATSGRASATASRAVQVSADGVTWVQVGWHPTVSSSPTQTSFVLPAGHYWRIVGAMDAANYLISELS